MSKKHTYEFIKDVFNKNGYDLLSDNYYSNNKKLIIKDNIGYLYYISFNSFLKLLKRELQPRKFEKSNIYTINNIKLWCELNNKEFILLSEEYKGSNKNLQWQCLKEGCDEIFDCDLNNILSNSKCPFCTGRRVSVSNCLATKNPILDSEWHPTKNGDLTPYDVTISSGKNVWWLCKNGHEWQDKICKRNIFLECPYCNHQRPSDEYNLTIIYPLICKDWDYDKNNKRPEEYLPQSHEYASWKCYKCGFTWETRINSRTKDNTECPECVSKNKGELQLKEILIRYFIKYVPQKTFPDCIQKYVLRFDSYLPDFNVCIEYNGRQHYEPVDFAGKGEEWAKDNFTIIKKHDQIKRDYCKNNNIKLIEIPYWYFNNIEEILLRELNLNNNIKAGDLSA